MNIWQFVIKEYKPKRKIKPRFFIFLLLIISICILVHFYYPTVKDFFSELIPESLVTTNYWKYVFYGGV